MATKKKISTKKKPAIPIKVASRSRQIAQPQYKSFRVSKRIKSPGSNLPPAWVFVGRSFRHLIKNWKIFGGITAVYALLTLVLVRGFTLSSTLPQTKEALQSLLETTKFNFTTSFTLYGVLIGTGAASSQVASIYQSLLAIVISLASVWALRQTYTKTAIKIRDTFYKGLYPLVPFMLVLLTIGLQLTPLLLANMLYGFVFGNGLAVTVIEKVLWIMLFFMFGLLTIYMITSSLFALYIVTLPDVEPLQALRSARELVRFRRWTVMRKILFLPLALGLISVIILVPLVTYVTVAAEAIYFILSMAGLIVIHAYLYVLYRELIA